MSQMPRFDEKFPTLNDPPAYKKRGHVVRMALFYGFWTALSLSLVALALFKIVTGDSGLIVMFTVFGIIGFLVGYHASHYVKDLKAAPVVREGPILRKWHKGNIAIVLFPSYYMMVDDHIYSIHRDEYAMLLEDDTVRITCYPHSLVVEKLERYDSNTKQFVPATSGASGY